LTEIGPGAGIVFESLFTRAHVGRAINGPSVEHRPEPDGLTQPVVPDRSLRKTRQTPRRTGGV